jgi:hypothetical protein
MGVIGVLVYLILVSLVITLVLRTVPYLALGSIGVWATMIPSHFSTLHADCTAFM